MTHDRPIPPDLAARINEVRARAGLSVGELAVACSLDRAHLQAVFTGQRALTPAVARRLLAAFHMHEIQHDLGELPAGALH